MPLTVGSTITPVAAPSALASAPEAVAVVQELGLLPRVISPQAHLPPTELPPVLRSDLPPSELVPFPNVSIEINGRRHHTCVTSDITALCLTAPPPSPPQVPSPTLTADEAIADPVRLAEQASRSPLSYCISR